MIAPKYDFGSKVALVTGGGSGIGQATAIAFARNGARVVVADISVEAAESTVKLIKDAGGEASFVQADVSKSAEVEAMVQYAVDTYGRLDIALNNAGFGGPQVKIAEVVEADYDRVMSVNLKGIYLSMKYEIPQMLKQGGGAIVNTASALGLIGMATSSVYVTTKHGVIGMTKSAALEYASEGIRINAICPGVIKTPLLVPTLSNPAVANALTSLHPIGRLGEVEEVAEAVLWLASEAAGNVVGTALTVDGGWTAH